MLYKAQYIGTERYLLPLIKTFFKWSITAWCLSNIYLGFSQSNCKSSLNCQSFIYIYFYQWLAWKSKKKKLKKLCGWYFTNSSCWKIPSEFTAILNYGLTWKPRWEWKWKMPYNFDSDKQAQEVMIIISTICKFVLYMMFCEIMFLCMPWT